MLNNPQRKPLAELYTSREAVLLNGMIVHVTEFLSRDPVNKEVVDSLLRYAMDLLDAYTDENGDFDYDDYEELRTGENIDEFI